MTKLFVFLAAAAAAFAQGESGSIAAPRWRPIHVALDGQSGPVVGRPLEATEVRHNLQVLSDGTKLESSSTTRFWRDSQGRMRTESPERIEIYDPIGGAIYDLDPQHQTYIKSTSHADAVMIAVDGSSSRVSSFSGTPHPDRPSHVDLGIPYQKDKQALTTKEDLPPQVLNGVSAHGSRITSTVPAGAVNNDREFKIVSERWYSDDLQLLLKTSNSDPRFGINTYELTNIKQGPPDPSLFQVPAGYTERAGH